MDAMLEPASTPKDPAGTFKDLELALPVLAAATGVNGPREGGPKEVRVRVSVRHVINIDLLNQCFKVAVQFEASWIAHGLKDEVRKARTKRQDGSWKWEDMTDEEEMKCVLAHFDPIITMQNCVEQSDYEKWVRVYDDAKEDDKCPPIVCLRWTLTGLFQESMELGLFPIDAQSLTITLKAGVSCERMRLVRNQSPNYKSLVASSNFIQDKEYRLYDRLKFGSARTDGHESASGTQYDLLHISARVQRNAKFWCINISFPLFLIGTCALTSYAAPPSEFSTRSSIDMAVLLAVIAFKYMIGDKLPTINYSTIIDLQVLITFISVFVILVEQALAAKGMFSESGVDTAIIGSWFGGHLLFILVFVGLVYERKRRERFWSVAENAVWIGPLVVNDGDCLPSHVHALSMIKMLVVGDTPMPQRAIVWTAKDAQKSLKNAGVDEPYHGSRPFLVLTYASDDEARTAVRELEKSRPTLPQLIDKAHIELLNPNFQALTQNFTYNRSSSEKPLNARVVPAVPLGLRDPPGASE